MTLMSLRLPAGIARNGTAYNAKGRWYDGRFIRFFQDSIRPIGSWQQLQITTGGNPAGLIRAMLAWRNNAGQPRLAIGTNTKAYVFIESVLTDITLAGTTTGSGSSSFASGLYGSGNYGASYYGVGDSTQSALTVGGSWQFDTFGQILLGVLSSDGRLLQWDGNTANDFTAFTGGAPTGNIGVVVTNERFVFALGAGGDARKIQWASQESTTDWTSTATNTAGDFLLPGSGKILCGRRGRNLTLIFTDQDVFAAQYIGGTLIYAFTQLAADCGLIGPNAVAVIDGKAEWMGQNGFYQYDGYVRPLACEVQDYVFGGLNKTQAFKCFALPFPDFNEVWYFFPSTDASQPDEPERYVIHNYAEGHWTIGSGMIRSAGTTRGVFAHPFMASPTTSAIYEHELGGTAGLIWAAQTSSFGTTDIYAVTYGNGVYVAVGKALTGAGTIASSVDGITWTQRTSNFGGGDILAVTYGNGVFVAGGSAGALVTSPDGTTWTSRTSGFSGNIKALAYGNGLFVGTNDIGDIRTSPTGVTWTARTSNFTGSLNGLVFGNQRFVAVGDGTRIATTSADGVTWTLSTTNTGGTNIAAIAYGGGVYVAAGLGNSWSSSDGVTWTQGTGAPVTTIYAIAYASVSGIFIAGAASQAMTSADGSHWVSSLASTAISIAGLVYAHGLLVAVGFGGKLAIADDPPATAYLESGPVELGEGDRVMELTAVIPDESSHGVQNTTLGVELFAALYPTGTETMLGPYTLANPTSIRATARQVRIRIGNIVTGTAVGDWRLGIPRLEVRPGSKR